MQTLRSETFGQPTYVTHPHLVNEGEIVIGQTVDTFRERRSWLLSGIQKLEESEKKFQHKKAQMVKYLYHMMLVFFICRFDFKL